MCKKNILVLLIVFSFILKTNIFAQDLSNNCCCENSNISVEKVKNHNLLFKLDSALAEYYKTNPWVFLEDVFIDLKESRWYNFKFIVKKYLSVTGVSCSVGAATFFICSLLDSDLDAKLILSVITTALTAGVSIVWFKHFFDYYLDKKILKDFLENYFIDSNMNYKFNYRDMVPQELRSAFDHLKMESDKNYDYVFRKFGSKIVKQLREDIIFKKNPNKYHKPVVYVENIN